MEEISIWDILTYIWGKNKCKKRGITYGSKKIDRLGETKIMNCGMEATIIRYKVLPFSGPFFYVADFLTHYK